MTDTATPPLLIDVGIFAHDEAATIGTVIEAVGGQDIMSCAEIDLRVIVLANGCTDDTVAHAREAAARLPSGIAARFDIVDLQQPGKSRTAHLFVHALSRAEAGLLCFMDADIRMPRTDTLRLMTLAMVNRPELRVFNSRPVKDVDLDRTGTGVIARLIAAGGGGLDDWRTSICGQLFMVRAAAARRIGLPSGLPVDDGFMRAMILTDLLSAPEDLTRIDGDPAVFHVYSSIRGLRELVRHQTRIVIGSAVNAAIFARIEREAPNEAAAHRLLMEAAENKEWISETLRAGLPRRPYGYVPFGFLTKRLRRSRQEGARSLKRRLITLGGAGLDALVWARASAIMMRGAGANYW